MLSGKLAFVTGAGSGIGRATCKLLSRESAHVIATDVNEYTLQNTIKLLNGINHSSYLLDVSQYEQVQEVFNNIAAKYSNVPTIIVNSAGITKDSFMLKMNLEDFHKVINVNLIGTFNVSKIACMNLLENRQKGAIVNIASIVGQTGNKGQSNYAASKAGVEALTKTIAKEMAEHNIRCNAVVPGFIESPMTDIVPLKVKQMFQSFIPLGRLGDVNEVAEVIAFLASDRSSYMTGACIPVTGGL